MSRNPKGRFRRCVSHVNLNCHIRACCKVSWGDLQFTKGIMQIGWLNDHKLVFYGSMVVYHIAPAQLKTSYHLSKHSYHLKLQSLQYKNLKIDTQFYSS